MLAAIKTLDKEIKQERMEYERAVSATRSSHDQNIEAYLSGLQNRIRELEEARDLIQKWSNYATK